MAMIDTDTAEGKAELQKLIDAETKGLKTKNDELLGKVKKQGDDMKGIQEQLDELKAANEAAEEEAAKKSGDVSKITEALEAKHKKERDALKAELDKLADERRSDKIDGALNAALAKAGVAPQYIESAFDNIKARNKAELIEVDGKTVAQIGGKEITEFVTAWAQGDSGKHFVAAPANGGGGAKGAGGGGKAYTGKADMGGDKTARAAAIAQKYPELNQ